MRLFVVVGGVVVPVLIGLDVSGTAKSAIGWTAFGLSLLVGICAAIEGFFHLGERWRHYRRTVEQLKSEGWEYSQLGGPYAQTAGDHASTFPIFVGRVQEILGREVDEYVTTITEEREKSQAVAG